MDLLQYLYLCKNKRERQLSLCDEIFCLKEDRVKKITKAYKEGRKERKQLYS